MFAGFLDTATQYRTISGSFDLGSWSEGTVHPSRRQAGRQAEQLQETVASSVRPGDCGVERARLLLLPSRPGTREAGRERQAWLEPSRPPPQRPASAGQCGQRYSRPQH